MDQNAPKHITQVTIGQDNPTIVIKKIDSDDNENSDREVKPKFVVGTKKYGRRSRPDVLKSDDDDADEDESDHANASGTKNETYYVSPGASEEESKRNKVQRSASQSDIHGTKRKRPLSASRLKRCASLPPQRNMRRPPIATREKVNDESLSNLSEIWNAFGSNSLTLSQLEVVCENLGLHGLDAKQAAREAFEKLSLRNDAQIAYTDFLKLIQSDSNVLSRENSLSRLNAATTEECGVQLIKDTGTVNAEIIVQMWDTAGVATAHALLVGLGFSSQEIQIPELIVALEDEIQRCQNEKEATPYLKASLTLYKAENGALRQAFKQLLDENKKLHTRNKEANNRAALLAQEVDERHSNIEKSTRNEIRTLEQRHAEAIRELSVQITLEREQYTAINARLETRIKNLESEDNKLKAEVTSLLEENSALDGEKCDLQGQIADLYEQNIKLNQEVAELEEKRGSDIRDERTDEEILELIDKVSSLQMENANLRDKNDELSAEVEGLTLEMSKMKRDEPTINNKRRGDSPSKVRNCEESPRLGKLRKFDDGSGIALESELQTSSGFSSEPSTEDTKSLEDTNAKSTMSEFEKYKQRCQDLEASLEQMRKEYEDCEDYWQNKLAEERALYEEEQRQNDDKLSELLRKMSDYEEQFAEKEGKLTPIEENSMLEQQYNALETEMEELKEKARNAIADKEKEVCAMKLKLKQYEYAPPTPPRVDTPDSPASSTISYLFWNQSSIHGPARDYQNPNFNPLQENTYKEEVDTGKKSVSPIERPSKKDDAKSVASTHSVHKSEGASSRASPFEEPDVHINEGELREEIQLLAHQRDCLIVELQQLQEAKPILAKAYARTPHPSLTNRIQFLENKNKHLNYALKQQQTYMETIIHQTWQQQRMEIAELRNRLEAQSVVIAEQAQRLANADLLAKDLFVENSHLTATIQRLEQQRTRQALMQLSQHLPHLQQQGLSGMP